MLGDRSIKDKNRAASVIGGLVRGVEIKSSVEAELGAECAAEPARHNTRLDSPVPQTRGGEPSLFVLSGGRVNGDAFIDKEIFGEIGPSEHEWIKGDITNSVDAGFG